MDLILKEGWVLPGVKNFQGGPIFLFKGTGIPSYLEG